VSARVEAALSLGSNLGDRRACLAAALRGLAAGPLAALEVSSLWETEPVEVAAPQPAYLNLTVVGRTALAPEDLLRHCRALEQAAGREREGHGLPRALDVDLLYCGAARSDTPALRLPHPGLARRRFVLAPLAELRPGWRHPDGGRSVADMLAALGEGQPVRRLAVSGDWWCAA
jgi:2-amino-4-hydroxy-6-hydroxymethyldihydropteridine diphosphokinase